MATLIKADGTQVEVTPANETAFDFDELATLVGGYFEELHLPDGRVLVVVGEPYLTTPPLTLNQQATILYRLVWVEASSIQFRTGESAHSLSEVQILGDALLTTPAECGDEPTNTTDATDAATAYESMLKRATNLDPVAIAKALGFESVAAMEDHRRWFETQKPEWKPLDGDEALGRVQRNSTAPIVVHRITMDAPTDFSDWTSVHVAMPVYWTGEVLIAMEAQETGLEVAAARYCLPEETPTQNFVGYWLVMRDAERREKHVHYWRLYPAPPQTKDQLRESAALDADTILTLERSADETL